MSKHKKHKRGRGHESGLHVSPDGLLVMHEDGVDYPCGREMSLEFARTILKRQEGSPLSHAGAVRAAQGILAEISENLEWDGMSGDEQTRLLMAIHRIAHCGEAVPVAPPTEPAEDEAQELWQAATAELRRNPWMVGRYDDPDDFPRRFIPALVAVAKRVREIDAGKADIFGRIAELEGDLYDEKRRLADAQELIVFLKGDLDRHAPARKQARELIDLYLRGAVRRDLEALKPPAASPETDADERDQLGRIVRAVYVKHAGDRDPASSIPWEQLDASVREAECEMGEAVAEYVREKHVPICSCGDHLECNGNPRAETGHRCVTCVTVLESDRDRATAHAQTADTRVTELEERVHDAVALLAELYEFIEGEAPNNESFLRTIRDFTDNVSAAAASPADRGASTVGEMMNTDARPVWPWLPRWREDVDAAIAAEREKTADLQKRLATMEAEWAEFNAAAAMASKSIREANETMDRIIENVHETTVHIRGARESKPTCDQCSAPLDIENPLADKVCASCVDRKVE